MSGSVCEVVITAPDADWLVAFVRQLVEDKLAACGHITPSFRSVYWWQGEMHDKHEARVALHTRCDLVSAISDRTREQHPYKVPCVIASEITAGNPEYLSWILKETLATGRNGD